VKTGPKPAIDAMLLPLAVLVAAVAFYLMERT
jgi:hypothetical protein